MIPLRSVLGMSVELRAAQHLVEQAARAAGAQDVRPGVRSGSRDLIAVSCGAQLLVRHGLVLVPAKRRGARKPAGAVRKRGGARQDMSRVDRALEVRRRAGAFNDAACSVCPSLGRGGQWAFAQPPNSDGQPHLPRNAGGGRMAAPFTLPCDDELADTFGPETCLCPPSSSTASLSHTATKRGRVRNLHHHGRSLPRSPGPTW